MRTLALVCLMLSISGFSYADWTLNNDQSSLTFLSTKNQHITEISHFEKLSGEFNGKTATLEIDLTSVDSLIPIRNERMLKWLFETAKFAKANINVSIDPASMKKLNKNTHLNTEVEATVDLHGTKKKLTAKVFISKSNNTLTVVSTQPILVQANDFLLVKGINKLQEIAKLKSISHTVPVSFNLQYTK